MAKAGTWTESADAGKSPALKALNAAPFYEVARIAGLAWLAVDPASGRGDLTEGTGLIYLTSSSRISFGLSKNGYIPKAFEKNSPKTKVPVFGIIVTTVIGLLFLLPFPSWGKLVGVVTSASVLMYAGAPLALGALRLQKPDLPRAYTLPVGKVLAPLSFVVANFIVYWSGWGTYSTLMVVMLLGFALMLVSGVFHLNPNQPQIDWGAAVWVFPYLMGMGIISYLGGFGQGGIIGGVGVFAKVLVGGNGDLPLYADLLVLTVFSLVIYYLAIARRCPPPRSTSTCARSTRPPVTE